MKTEILKLDRPYKYITCNGSTALHIATLIVYEATEDEDGEYVLNTHSHPIVRYFDCPDGTVWNRAELRDCEVVCSEDEMRLSLKKFRKILSRYPESYDNEMEGTGLNPIWKKDLEDIGIQIVWPMGEDGKEHYIEFEVKLDIKPNKRFPYVCQDWYTDFFFYVEADDQEELKRLLVHKRDWYYYVFKEHQFTIKFTCDDKRYDSLIKEVNETKPKEI